MKPPFSVTIVPGDVVANTWCAVCQLPVRLRVPLHAGSTDGPLLATLEVCPGCGANHATPSVTVVPRPGGWLAALRRNQEGPGCAYGDCRRSGSMAHSWKLHEDEGTTTYLFCKPGHRKAWLEENGFAQTGYAG